MKINKDSKFKTNYQLFTGETITDLTGYTWVGNDYVDLSNFGKAANSPYYINFNDANNISYTNIHFEYFGPMEDECKLFYSSSDVGYGSGINEIWFYSSALKTIQFTGGTDATNSTLIAWLEANGTLTAPQPAGYSSTITLTNCTCNKSSESSLSGSYSATITADDGYYLSSVTSTIGTATISTNKKTASIEISDITADFTITATGTAKTIKNVMLHPNNNGETDYTTDIMPQVNSASELEINRLFRTRYTITPTITNGNTSGDEYIWSEETAQVTIIPEENYSLPSSITVSGASYTYDSTSGVVSLSNPTGNVSITAECEAQVTGYEVELSGEYGDGEYIYVQINDDPNWYYAQINGSLQINDTNIPNIYEKPFYNTLFIPNVTKIKIGTQGDPSSHTGPLYSMNYSTGNFANLTFTSTGGSAPAYTTGEITMTQDSMISFVGNDY